MVVGSLAWAFGIPDLTFCSYVTLGTLLPLSESQGLICKCDYIYACAIFGKS